MNSVPTFNAPVSRLSHPPRIYYVHPLHPRAYDAWSEIFEHAHRLGFATVLSAPLFRRGKYASIFVSSDFDRIDPALALEDDVQGTCSSLAKLAARYDVRLMLDLVVDRVAHDDADVNSGVVDPRIPPDATCSRSLDLAPSDLTYRYLEEWRRRIGNLIDAGIAGFRCLGINRVPQEAWASLIKAAKTRRDEVDFLAWTPGTGPDH